MADSHPNIILITTDQQRGDCLGIEGHPVLQTPNLDWMGRAGTHFRRGYAECPSCIPARRALMSGQAPDANGMVGFADGVEWNPKHTLAGELGKAGYQTEMIGKLHLHPRRKRFGFDHMRLADATHGKPGGDNDYVDWLAGTGATEVDPGVVHGVSANGWVGRPHHLPEERMHTTWCVSESLDFLEKRDPATPFFLNLSFIDPHPPLTCPRFYYDRYLEADLPDPVVGDWAPPFEGPERGMQVDGSRICLDRQTMRYARAAYYGMINYVDDQIGRLINALKRNKLFNNTFILFTSDHGEMLGDHHIFRKTFAYEASARVPFLAWAPPSMGCPPEQATRSPVGLQDIMPTLLEVAGAPVPETVTGRSLLPVIRGETDRVREVLHGEHSGCYRDEDGMHFLTDGRWKYIWYSQTGQEQFFDLEEDPNEMRDLARKTDAGAALEPWRQRLAERLGQRPEGFSDGSRLIPGKPHGTLVPERNG